MRALGRESGPKLDGGFQGMHGQEAPGGYGPAEVAHPMAIVGTTITRRLFELRAMYERGSSTPMAKSPVARTTRVISSVNTLVFSVQERGLKRLAQWGPIAAPKPVPRTTSLMYSFVERCQQDGRTRKASGRLFP
jgi:hypothetical protein